MNNINFGLGLQYDTGKHSDITIAQDGTVIEVHKSAGSDTLWYHVGKCDNLTVKWSDSKKYDKGITPSVMMNNNHRIVEVHESDGPSSALWYHVGELKEGSVKWSDSKKYDKGNTPKVALNDKNIVVEVHKSEGFDTLWYHVGELKNNSVEWSDSREYDKGTTPSIAINNNDIIIEVHTSNGPSNNLWYHVGKLEGQRISWGSSIKLADREGVNPSIAINEQNEVVLIYSHFGKLYSLTGVVENNSVLWNKNTIQSFDTGCYPSAAMASASNSISNAEFVIQSHSSESGTGLFYSVSLLTNTEQWMQRNWDFIKNKTLDRIVLPGSHDAAMYDFSAGQTQKLSIYQQLKYGIRFFDLRPGYTNNRFHIFHGPIQGPALETVLEDIKKYYTNNYTEIIILKFSHYKNFTTEIFKQMVDIIISQIGALLFKGNDEKQLSEIQLNFFCNQNTPVIAVFDEEYSNEIVMHQQGILRYYDGRDEKNPSKSANISIYDKYSDTINLEKMMEDQKKKYDTFSNYDKGLIYDLFLLSWTLTPPTLVTEISKQANRVLADSLSQFDIPSLNNKIPNILYVDCVEDSRATELSILLNQKI